MNIGETILTFRTGLQRNKKNLEESKMKCNTMIIYEDSYINGKLVKDMTNAEKDAFVKKQEAKGCKVIFKGGDDELD
jgi:hypothetical protein